MKAFKLAIWSVALLSPTRVALAKRDPWSRHDENQSNSTNVHITSRARYNRGGTASSSKVNLLIKYKPSTSFQRVRNSLRRSERLNKLALTLTNVSKRHKIAEVKVNAADKDAVMRELMTEADVEMVEEDFQVRAIPYTNQSNLRLKPPHEKQQVGVDLIQAPQIWSAAENNPSRYSQSSIKVCIIDTGYDFGHEDLPTNDVTGTETIYGSALSDGDGHGTHCAGVIGAIGFNELGVVGVNPNPEKFSFHISKSLNAQGVGTSSSLIQGIEGCISSGSKIISMSVGGGPDSDIFREIYKEAYNEGVLVIAAAGNDGTTAHDYPASFPHVMSVGAVDRKGQARADFSNYNEQIEIMAPGVDVMSTAPDDSYRVLSGTSMATPYVAGVAALVWSYFPACSNNQIRNVLALTAKRLSPEGECNEYSGFGLIQAKAAFDALDQWGCDAPGEDPTPLSDGGIGGCAQALPEFRNKLENTPTKSPTPKPTMKPFSGDVGKGNSCKKIQLDLFTDKMAIETSWILERVDNGIREEIKSGPPSYMNYAPQTKYSVSASDCLGTGTYEFTIFDKFGDGIQDPGYYTIFLNGEALASNSDFGSSETTSIEIDNGFLARQPGVQPTTTPKWRQLLVEEFEDGFGGFIEDGEDILHKRSVLGRKGVACIQVANFYGQPSLSTDKIQMNEYYSKFEVAISCRSANLDDGQKLCLEYSPNNATAWSRAICWRSGVHFENGNWNDDLSTVFQIEGMDIHSLRIRIILADGTYMDRIYIDRVKLSAMQ